MAIWKGQKKLNHYKKGSTINLLISKMRKRKKTHKNYVAIKQFTTRLIRTNLSMAVKREKEMRKRLKASTKV